MSELLNDTQDASVPLFKNWSSWYWLAIIINLIIIALVYFYFNSL